LRTLYTLFLWLILPLVMLRLWWRGRSEPGYREAVEERFGFYEDAAKPKIIWVHAVSVGEVRAAAPLVRALQEAFPDHGLLVTCTTAAGREMLKQVYGESVAAAYLPYDYPHAIQRFLEHFRPRLGVLMETEVWPNLLALCAENRVPMMLASARMSEKSALRYQRWRWLGAPAFRSLAAVCAQSADDAARLRALGAGRVEVTGNLKFDVQPDAAQLAAGKAWRGSLGRPVLLLASTREGEERLLLDALPAGLQALVVVVPRHPQRFDELAQLAQGRRSRGDAVTGATRIYLGDTMGEMAFYYGACDVAVIGGSFVPVGGQNLIEALACGVPVVIGPSVFNFEQATQFALEAGAAVQAGDAASGIGMALRLLEDPKRTAMAEAGRALCARHRGATERNLAVCRELLTAPARG
jgi:3-deoxy-D-manno-octulosonic-acid transferase